MARELAEVVRQAEQRRPWEDLYHSLLVMSWPRLAVAIVGTYLVANGLFALGYLAGGDCIENARPGSFQDAFFFSVQTMATIGYGKLVPRTPYANALVALEALAGMVGTAMATGLMFAKFARPTARVLFSRHAIVGRFDGAPALMFRMANARGNQIVEAQLRVILSRTERTVDGEVMRRFHDLTLARSQTAIFALTWTAIHPLSRASPLHDATEASLAGSDVLLIVSLMGLDETSSQTVHARHTYYPEDLRWDARFVDILTHLPDGRRRIDYTHFHDIEPLAPTAARAAGTER